MHIPTTISYSSLNRWIDCPTAWRAQYIDKVRGPVGDNAQRGNDFDELVAKRLGLQVLERDGSTIKPPPLETEELTRMLDGYAADEESWLTTTKPEQKAHTQTKVTCSPERFSELAEQYGSTARIKVPYIGFIDFGRTMDDGVRTEILDLKTSDRAEFKMTWPMQVVTYAVFLGASKASIHLVVPAKKEVKVLKKEFLLGANKSIVRNCLNWAAFYHNQQMAAIENGTLADLPRQPGYHCYYCPLRPDCKVAGQ